VHHDPAVTTVEMWQQWSIDLEAFTGVNVKIIKKMSIGVSDRASIEMISNCTFRQRSNGGSTTQGAFRPA
jgi:hypothetical protein